MELAHKRVKSLMLSAIAALGGISILPYEEQRKGKRIRMRRAENMCGESRENGGNMQYNRNSGPLPLFLQYIQSGDRDSHIR